jgi:hypothetical protein
MAVSFFQCNRRSFFDALGYLQLRRVYVLSRCMQKARTMRAGAGGSCSVRLWRSLCCCCSQRLFFREEVVVEEEEERIRVRREAAVEAVEAAVEAAVEEAVEAAATAETVAEVAEEIWTVRVPA